MRNKKRQGSKKKEYLFVYGTLKQSETQKEVFGRQVKGTPDTLSGYCKTEIVINEEIYPVITPHKRRSIKGVVICVTKEELEVIDEYETAAYKRIRVRLKSGKIAWVYVKD